MLFGTAEDESYGPGTDLAISLFAVTLLLLVASIAAIPEEKVDDSEPPQEIADLREVEGRSNFESDMEGLTASAKRTLIAEQLPKVLAFLKQKEDREHRQVIIVGYTDPTTTRRSRREDQRVHNLRLSVRRALSVADLFYEHGVSYECMSVQGYGRSHSQTLREFMRDGASLAAWDSQGQYGFVELNGQGWSSRLASERVVRFIGVKQKGVSTNCMIE